MGLQFHLNYCFDPNGVFADAYSELKVVPIPATWKKVLDMDNGNTNPVIVTTRTIKGFSNKHADQRTITAINEFSLDIKTGAQLEVSPFTFASLPEPS